MDLTFNKEGKNFVAEFEATADFNLHIERNKGGDILLYVRTQGGGYDIVDDFGVQRHQGVIDYDCSALVYPKWIKIVSEVEPTYAAVVSDGEVTEIKAQSKEIEVTTNGTTVVTPDAGFAYLNSVKVKTNVATSGGGVGYLYFKNVPPMLESLVFSSLINDGTRIIPSFLCGFNSEGKEENITVRKIAAPYGYTWNDMKITEDFLREFMSVGDITEITEEEFYSLNNTPV